MAYHLAYVCGKENIEGHILSYFYAPYFPSL